MNEIFSMRKCRNHFFANYNNNKNNNNNSIYSNNNNSNDDIDFLDSFSELLIKHLPLLINHENNNNNNNNNSTKNSNKTFNTTTTTNNNKIAYKFIMTVGILSAENEFAQTRFGDRVITIIIIAITTIILTALI